MAAARSSRRKLASMMARLPGVSNAPPTPWNARAKLSTIVDGASPQATDATVNQTTPMRKMRRRPYRSLSAPPMRRSAASVSRYAVTIHCSAPTPPCSSRPIVGSATLTTVLSIIASPEPSTVAAITQRPRALASDKVSAAGFIVEIQGITRVVGSAILGQVRVLSSGRFSDGRDRPAVDDVLGAMNRGRAIRDQERDQLGDLFGPIGTTERNSAQRVHQALSRGALVDAALLGEAKDESMRGGRLGEAGSNRADAHTLGTHFVRQPLRVRRQRRLRSGVGERSVVERQRTLNRSDVNDHAGSLLQHRR